MNSDGGQSDHDAQMAADATLLQAELLLINLLRSAFERRLLRLSKGIPDSRVPDPVAEQLSALDREFNNRILRQTISESPPLTNPENPPLPRRELLREWDLQLSTLTAADAGDRIRAIATEPLELGGEFRIGDE